MYVLNVIDRQTSPSPEAAAAGTIAPDIATLSLESGKDRQTSPSPGKKRRAETDIRKHQKRGTSAGDSLTAVDPEFSRDVPYSMGSNKPHPKTQDNRLYNPKQGTKGTTSPLRANREHSSDTLADVALSPHQSSARITRQPGLIELQKYDPRYPGLLLQPDSRPISQEQLASEVKSIYAGLTMVETKCIHVDRAQAAAPKDNKSLAPDHWQALIALHRTLLHEHHDFFLASQHPSASPALRRLAAKYTMPARMWKHGIHSFLELLRQRLPESLDYMLAFIYLAYQMMALLYETVPAFEDTWIECLGDLGRYRMAIEDEDIRDRETWANVARSWYSKAADKNPTTGRLYHHLAILARPNALQQMYYYSRSLASVEIFPSARESIMTLLGFVLASDKPGISIPASPVDASFITAHALVFARRITKQYEAAQAEYLSQLDNHIGRVTAKWKEQGVYTAVSNSAAWLDYGVETNTIRLILELRARQRRHLHFSEDQIMTELNAQKDKPKLTEAEIPSAVKALSTDTAFREAVNLANRTLSVVCRRIGDKNVLPHVHVMLAFLSVLASIQYVADLIEQAPWAELVPFLNTLVKTETQQSQAQDVDALLARPAFAVGPESDDNRDELPLPEDYLVRGLIWGEEYFPPNYFDKENDEEERYLELASTAKRRSERVLRLGTQLSSVSQIGLI